VNDLRFPSDFVSYGTQIRKPGFSILKTRLSNSSSTSSPKKVLIHSARKSWRPDNGRCASLLTVKNTLFKNFVNFSGDGM
jgi:hypothetical protein